MGNWKKSELYVEIFFFLFGPHVVCCIVMDRGQE